MLRAILFIISFFCSIHSIGYAQNESDQRPIVMVSIAPYKFFVEAIAGNTVRPFLMVPPGASFHTYEPTPKQILEGSQAEIWFRIGESFEARALQALRSHHPNMQIVDLRKGVDLITVEAGHQCCCCHQDGADLHIWLSPRMAKVQAKLIAQTLSETYPQNRELYQQRLSTLLNNLDILDKEITQTLAPLQQRTIMVAHPAYAYFARDYNLQQLPIEYEGKDPSGRQLTTLLQQARAKNIKTIFIQNQYSSKGASLIAKELGAEVVTLDPYSSSGDYFATLREIARRISATN